MDPSTVGPKEITVLGFERLVVVFYTALESAVVLITVHRAVHASVIELHRGFGTKYSREAYWESGTESNDYSSLPRIRYEQATMANQDWGR